MTPNTLIPRREFLGASGVLTGLLVAGSPLALLAPSRAWALELKALSSSDGATLMAVSRTLAPHDKLDDAAYALVIQSVDASAAKDPQGRLRVGAAVGSGADFLERAQELVARKVDVLVVDHAEKPSEN